MSTIKSDSEDLTLNAHGSGNDIKFQSNSVEVGSLTAEGVMTSTTFAGSGASLTNIPAAQITGTLPAISGANLTGVGVDGISSSADATAITISSSEQVGIGATPISTVTIGQTGGGNGNQLFFPYSGGSTDRSYSIGTSAYGWGELDINSSDANDTTIDRRILNVSRDGDVKIMTGDLIFGTAGKGICLGVTTNTDANTLDDYEVGTWTPAWESGGTDPTISHSPVGGYVKVGDMVFVTINMGASSSASGGSSSNDLRIGGLPFAANGSYIGTITAPRGQNWNDNAKTPTSGSFNASQILLVRYSAAYASHTTVKTEDLRTSGDSNQFLTSGFYIAA